MLFKRRTAEERERSRRYRKGLGCLPQLIGFKIILVAIASVLMLPSTWRFFTQLSPVEFTEVSELAGLKHDTWIRGELPLLTDERATEIKKLGRRKNLAPLRGSGRAIFYSWYDFDFSPEDPDSTTPIDGRIVIADSWFHQSERDLIRQYYSDEGISIPEKLRIIKNHQPPSLGMGIWLVGFHIAPVLGIYWLWRRIKRAWEWENHPEAMHKHQSKGEAVDFTQGPPA